MAVYMPHVQCIMIVQWGLVPIAPTTHLQSQGLVTGLDSPRFDQAIGDEPPKVLAPLDRPNGHMEFDMLTQQVLPA